MPPTTYQRKFQKEKLQKYFENYTDFKFRPHIHKCGAVAVFTKKTTTRQILSIPSKKKKNIKYSLKQEEMKMTHKNEKYLQKEKIECFYMENT